MEKVVAKSDGGVFISIFLFRFNGRLCVVCVNKALDKFKSFSLFKNISGWLVWIAAKWNNFGEYDEQRKKAHYKQHRPFLLTCWISLFVYVFTSEPKQSLALAAFLWRITRLMLMHYFIYVNDDVVYFSRFEMKINFSLHHFHIHGDGGFRVCIILHLN